MHEYGKQLILHTDMQTYSVKIYTLDYQYYHVTCLTLNVCLMQFSDRGTLLCTRSIVDFDGFTPSFSK